MQGARIDSIDITRALDAQGELEKAAFAANSCKRECAEVLLAARHALSLLGEVRRVQTLVLLSCKRDGTGVGIESGSSPSVLHAGVPQPISGPCAGMHELQAA